MDTSLENDIRELIAHKTRVHGLYLVELNIKQTQSRLMIRAYVDHETGVTIDECSRLSRDIDAAIEAGRILGDAYTLEVSSPGIDRPLTEAWQFRKNVGRKLRIDFLNVRREPDQIKGSLIAVEAEWLVIAPSGKKKDAAEIRIPMDQVRQAVVELDW